MRGIWQIHNDIMMVIVAETLTIADCLKNVYSVIKIYGESKNMTL